MSNKTSRQSMARYLQIAANYLLRQNENQKGFPTISYNSRTQTLAQKASGPSTHPGIISYCFGNIPSPTVHGEYLKDNTMNIHIHSPEVNIQESESRMGNTWLFSHWLYNKLSVKVIHYKFQPRLCRIIVKFTSPDGGPCQQVCAKLKPLQNNCPQFFL